MTRQLATIGALIGLTSAATLGRPAGARQDEIRAARALFKAVDARDVRVMQRREKLGFPSESRDAVGIARDRGLERRDGDGPAEYRVAGLVGRRPCRWRRVGQ